jgi:hypothetical protein
MKKVFYLTNRFLILGTPLILFSLLLVSYLLCVAKYAINLQIVLIVFSLMTAMFVAGWGKMIKQAILNPEQENPNLLIKEFPIGVGEYFFSSLGYLINLFIILIIISTISFLAYEQFVNYYAPISQRLLSMYSASGMVIISFLSMLYAPRIFFDTKNPYTAFILSLKDLFSKHFFNTFGIFLSIFLINMLISIISTICAKMPVAMFFLILINFYFVTLASVGIFYYYYKVIRNN